MKRVMTSKRTDSIAGARQSRTILVARAGTTFQANVPLAKLPSVTYQDVAINTAHATMQ